MDFWTKGSNQIGTPEVPVHLVLMPRRYEKGERRLKELLRDLVEATRTGEEMIEGIHTSLIGTLEIDIQILTGGGGVLQGVLEEDHTHDQDHLRGEIHEEMIIADENVALHLRGIATLTTSVEG